MSQLNGFLFKSISYNMIMQLAFRLISFFLNALLVRYVKIEFIGACNFRLTLLYTTVMFLSREPFRRALPSYADLYEKQTSRWSSFINTLWLMLLNNFIITIALGFTWYRIFDKPDESAVPYYQETILVCCLAYFIEIIGEIPNCMLQINLIVKPRVYIEAISLLLFQFLYVFLTIQYPFMGAYSYAIARLAFSISYTVLSYQSYFKLPNQPSSILPHNTKHRFDYEYLNLIKAYYTQSIFKQILTEGEKYMITLFNLLSFSESGIYDIINNLGSLIARFLFLPIEDASYVLFKNSFKRGVSYADQLKQAEEKEETKNELKNAKRFFEYLLKFVSFIGLFIFVYGQAYSKIALHLFGGVKLSDSPVTVNMLRFYSLYVFFISINGITESLLNSTMSDEQLNRHNYRLVLFSAIYLIFALVFVKLFHIYGFILANCFNMLLRIVYNFKYIQSLFYGYSCGEDEDESFIENRKYSFLELVFSKSLVLNFLFILALAFTKLSEFYVSSYLMHILVGLFILFVNLLFLFKFENQFIRFLFRNIKNLAKNKAN